MRAPCTTRVTNTMRAWYECAFAPRHSIQSLIHRVAPPYSVVAHAHQCAHHMQVTCITAPMVHCSSILPPMRDVPYMQAVHDVTRQGHDISFSQRDGPPSSDTAHVLRTMRASTVCSNAPTDALRRAPMHLCALLSAYIVSLLWGPNRMENARLCTLG